MKNNNLVKNKEKLEKLIEEEKMKNNNLNQNKEKLEKLIEEEKTKNKNLDKIIKKNFPYLKN